MSYERHAYWCTHKTCAEQKVRTRIFINAGDPIPRCPVTGHGRMTRQENRPYMGKAIKDAARPE